MNKQEMADILLELRDKLENDQGMDSHQRQVTEALAEEINRQINDPKTDMAGDEYLLNKFSELVKDFEAAHPEFTSVVGRLSDVLARMGI